VKAKRENNIDVLLIILKTILIMN